MKLPPGALLRGRGAAVLPLRPLAAVRCAAIFDVGAGDWNRTHNLLITNQLLCQLSYTGAVVPRGGIEPPT